MIRVCSWCKTDQSTGKKLSDDEYHATTQRKADYTHTICQSCLTKEANKIEAGFTVNAYRSIGR